MRLRRALAWSSGTYSVSSINLSTTLNCPLNLLTASSILVSSPLTSTLSDDSSRGSATSSSVPVSANGAGSPIASAILASVPPSP